MAVNGKTISGNDLKSFYAAAQKSAAQGGLRTEIESGTEAPALLMPGSPLKALQDAISQTVKTITVPEGKKTAADKMWDRANEPQMSETTQAKQKKKQAEKKLKDFEEKTDLDWTDAAARELYENQRRKLQAEVDSAGEALAHQEDSQVQSKDVAEMEKMTAVDKEALEQYAVNQIRDQNLPVEMVGVMPTAQQEASELIHKIGQQRVNELAETYMRQENAELARQTEEKARQMAKDNWAAASLLTIPVSAVNGVVSTVGQLQGAARSTGRYSTLDSNATGTIGDTFTGAVRGQAAQDAQEKHGWLASAAYQGIMSLADTIARGVLGGGAFGGATLAATGSFSQTMADASRQGATPAQAALLATATAGIEALSEKLPLDNLIKTAKGGNGSAVVKNIFRQMGIEIMEEEASLLGTLLAEAAILQEKSNFNQNVTAKILLGKSPEEARQDAALDLFWEAVNTALVSGISGAAGGVGSTAMGKVLGNIQIEQTAAADGSAQPKTKAELMAKYATQQAKPEAQRAQEAMDTTMEEAAQKVPQTAPAPLTEEQQHMVNATAAVNGMEPVNQPVQQAQETAVPEETTVNVKSAGTALTEQNKEKNTLAYTLASNLDSVRDMTPVSQLTGREFNDRTKKIPEQIRDFFKSLGNKVARAGFGDVSLGEYGIGGIMNHRPLNRSKMVSLAAVPDVIKNGRQIAYEPNWKDRGYETFTFAAPVTVNGTEVYVAAVVNRKPDNKFYLSEMVDSQGNYVRIEESPSGNSKYGVTDGAENSGKAGMPMGPEGLSEGSNPSATAEPMPLPNNSISELTHEVNQNPDAESDESNTAPSSPTTDTRTAVYTRANVAQEHSTEGGQQSEPEAEQPKLQRDRINSARDQAIPATDPDGKVVSEAAGNIYTSSRTPDSFAENIRRLVNEGRVSHDVQTNEESLNKAAASIAEDGSIENALDSIKEVAASGRTGALDVAKGVLIYDALVNSDNPDHQIRAEECFVTLSQLATNTGRPMQLFSLFRKMTPESQCRVLEKEVLNNTKRLQKAGTVKKGYKPDIDPELMDLYREAAGEMQNAKSDKAKREAEAKMQDIQNVIYAEAAVRMPTTFKAKWDAWRYMAMLGNAKTQVRNLAGNTLMLPYTDAKRAVGAILEKGISKDKRTKAVFVDPQLLQWAKQDRANVKSVLEGSAKLGDNTAGNPLTENIKTFGDKWIGERFNDMQGIIDKAVSGGDMLFKNGEYARSLAGFLKARGYTEKDVQTDGGVPTEVLNEARNYAVNEALKATFNDTNMLSDALANGLRYKGDNPIMKAINTLGEGVMPFRKTPANVVMRFKDYSPAGLVQGVWNLAANVRNGKVTAATAIDQIAAGLTGTALMQLGYVLAGGIAGVKLTGSGADEDEKRQGHQNYAIEFSVDDQEYSYTIDWAAPANLPLFLGANIRAMQEAPDTASFLTAAMNAARGALEPLLELSCMSSLNDFFESNRYAGEGEALYAAIANLATSYFTQGIPSIARQATQALTENKQTTFVTSDDPVIGDVQKTIAGLGVGNAYKTDKRNAWGEKELQGDGLSSLTGMSPELSRAIDALFNPGTLKKIDNSAVEQEITRLNKAGHNVTPNTAARTVSYIDKDGTGHDDVRLTEEQFQKLAETQGQTARKLLDDMISSKSYAGLTDEQKAEAINTAYLYARKTGEIDAIKDHTGYDQSWFYDVEKGGAEEILRRVLNSGLNTSMSDLDTAWDRGYNEETFSRELQTAYDSYQKAPAAMKKQVYAEAEGTAKKYIEARDKGVSHEDFVAVAENIAKVKGTGSINKDTGKTTVRDIDRRQAIANTTGMTEKEIDIVMKAYMADYDPSAESPETTEMKYDYIRQELDLCAKEYTATYRAYLDADKKTQKIAAIQALGYDWGTAYKLYKVYAGSMKKKLIDMYG